MGSNIDKPVLTLDEVAIILGISRASVNRLVRQSRLRVARIGNRTVRVTDEALRDFLKSEETTGPVRRGAIAGSESANGQEASGA